MRRIGTLSSESLARRFCDYMVTLSIDATADPESSEPQSEWSVWVRDERHVTQAKQELSAFQHSPNDACFQVSETVSQIREQKVNEEMERRRTHQSMPSGDSGAARMIEPGARQQKLPVTVVLIVLSVMASFASGLKVPYSKKSPTEKQVYEALSVVEFQDYLANDEDPWASVRKGEVWRLITPMFMHGDEFHLLFNMMWIFFLGSAIERLHGSWFFLMLALGAAVVGMVLQVSLSTFPDLPDAVRGSPFAIGASGAVYGLFGFLWIRPLINSRYPIRMVPMNVVLMLGWLVACMTPLIPGVANGAHVGGLLAGILVAVAWPKRK
ncbi:MAG: rhomboid family intramembrane serine protease [Rubripirellula sp.]